MRVINVSKTYENITIPFDDGTVFQMRADFKNETITKAIDVLKRNNGKAKELMACDDEAEATSGAVGILEEIFLLVIGKEQYEGLVRAIGGEDASPAEVSFQLTIIWVELVDMIRKRFASFNESKASHYLTEYYANADAD